MLNYQHNQPTNCMLDIKLKLLYNRKSFGSSTFDLRPSTFDLRPSTFDLYYVLKPASAPRVCGVDLYICYLTSLKEVFRSVFPALHSVLFSKFIPSFVQSSPIFFSAFAICLLNLFSTPKLS